MWIANARLANDAGQAGDTAEACDALRRALVAIKGIHDADGWARALAAVTQAMAQVPQPGDVETAGWMVEAFRRERERSREKVWKHIRYFAAVLAKLGVIREMWEGIQRVEVVRRTEVSPSPSGATG